MTAFYKNPRVIVPVALVLLIVNVILVIVVWRQTSETVAQPVPVAPPVASSAEDTPPTGLAAADRDGDGIVYRSGMHPWIIQDEPGQCPVCGMDLQPVSVTEVEAGTVRIDPTTLQNIGVRTTTVTVESLQRTVRTTGRFEADEQRVVAFAPKISGWIERLYVNYEGARVAAGRPLFELYSPELVSTQEEYLLAVRNLERLADSPAAADARRLVEAARRRLAYWDISEEQIRQLEATGAPQRTLTFYAPASGTVAELNAVQGQQVSAGQTMLRLANLGRLWLLVDVYEQDLAWVAVGTTASIELPYAPGQRIAGTVSYLYDMLDPATRTLKARVEVPNPDRKLKPGMYATVTLLGGEAPPAPTVPAEALLRTGAREVVIVSLGEGRFMPAAVVAGAEADGRVQILEGLHGGEEVVTSAQFLIDSEARLASAVSAMVGRPGPAPGNVPTTEHAH